jgi:hypothetical protein
MTSIYRVEAEVACIHVWTIWRYIPEGSNIHNYRCENFKRYILIHLRTVDESCSDPTLWISPCGTKLSSSNLVTEKQLCAVLCMLLIALEFSQR